MKLASHVSKPTICAFALSVAAATLDAQSLRFSVGAGMSLPTGAYGTNDTMGWHLLGAAVVPSPVSNVLLRLDGTYSATTHQGSDNGHTRVGGGGASLVWRLRGEGRNLSPYLLGGLGVYDVATTRSAAACLTAYCSSSNSVTALAWSGGGGLALGLGSVVGFVEARFLTIRTSGTPTNLLPLTIGLTFGTH
jgi:hypothetical protein